MSKKDEINKLYLISSYVTNTNNILFFINVVLSFLSLFSTTSIKEIFIIMQICLSALFVILTLINECWLWYDAECARRKGSIQNAFGINLQEFKTEGYYNNRFSPSLIKYAANTFESNFFSKKIAFKMLPSKIVVSCVALITFFISSRYIVNGELLLIMSQLAFSSYFILDSIILLTYCVRMRYLYNKAYEQLVTFGIVDKEQLIWIMYYIVEYECVKSYTKIRLSRKIFKKCNPALSKEWNSIKKKIKISDL